MSFSINVEDLKDRMTPPGLVITTSLLLAISIAHITVGAKYVQECPQQHCIPVYLVVCGVGCIVLLLALFYCMTYLNKIPCSFWSGAVAAFTFCWFINGSVWTFSIYPPNYNSTLPGEPYCNKTLYQFALVTIILTCLTLVILLMVGCYVRIRRTHWRAVNTVGSPSANTPPPRNQGSDELPTVRQDGNSTGRPTDT